MIALFKRWLNSGNPFLAILACTLVGVPVVLCFFGLMIVVAFWPTWATMLSSIVAAGFVGFWILGAIDK